MDWQIEFDKKFVKLDISYPVGSERSEVININELISFIQDLLDTRDKETVEGIRRWSEMGWKEGWFEKKNWTGDDEVAASIQSYIRGEDINGI